MAGTSPLPCCASLSAATNRSRTSSILCCRTAMRLLVKYHYKEGIRILTELAMGLPGHGSQKRIPALMQMLKSYGSHARPIIPELRKLVKKLNRDVAERRFPGGAINRKRTDSVEEAIKFLQQTGDAPALRSLPAK